MTKVTKKTKPEIDYGFYSRVLKQPFDSLEDLALAEEAHYAEQKAKEDKAAQKKADAKKVEDAFKALNAARKAYKEDLTQLTKEYSEEFENLKKAYELGKKNIHNTLATAEDAYSQALKEFTDKYENYHICLKDGDFETTISGGSCDDVYCANTEKQSNTTATRLDNLLDLVFGNYFGF
jgi:benzoyl-CoA reductase/2-hydroxyglutaryl-CoA dehydratase subunit BcrC/BadD/HgdB